MVIAHGNKTKHVACSTYKHKRTNEGSSGCVQINVMQHDIAEAVTDPHTAASCSAVSNPQVVPICRSAVHHVQRRLDHFWLHADHMLVHAQSTNESDKLNHLVRQR